MPGTLSRERPLFVLAPMVDQSDLPFRILTMRYGVDVAFTPMIHSKMYCTCERYRAKFRIDGGPQLDRPLIAQMCGSSAEYCLRAALELQEHCDGIDVNCGCPQNIARRGNYGAFLLEKPDELVEVVRTLVDNLSVPVSCKVRLLPREDDKTKVDLERSMQLYRRLVDDAGIAMLTVHGRTRHQKSHETGAADWDAIAAVVREFSGRIPVLANGSIGSRRDAIECWERTGADGIMSSEAVLEYPALFACECEGDERPRAVGRIQLAREYLELAEKHPPQIGGQGNGVKCIRMHLHRMLHADLQANPTIRIALTDAKTLSELARVVDTIQELHDATGHDVAEEKLSWYVRHRTVDASGRTQREREANGMKQSNGDDGDEENDSQSEEVGNCCFLWGDDDGDVGDY